TGEWPRRGCAAKFATECTMESDRWRRIDDLFQAALDCEPDRRAALLETSCEGDQSLRAEIESLLAAYQQSGFTGTPAVHDGVRLLEQTQSVTGRRIGPYQVLR